MANPNVISYLPKFNGFMKLQNQLIPKPHKQRSSYEITQFLILEGQSNHGSAREKLLPGSAMGSSIKCVRKMFRQTNGSNPLIRTRTCAYQGARNISFSENFAYVLNGWPLLWRWPLSLRCVRRKTRSFLFECVCFKLPKCISELLTNLLFSWISYWFNYYSCYLQIVSKTLEDSGSGFSIDECTDNSHVTGCYYIHTVCGTTLVADGTSSDSGASILRNSIGVQATPHMKTTRVQYKSHGIKNKLVQSGRHTSDHAV